MIDLHLHLDGSLRPETVYELAKEQNITLVADSVEELIPLLRVPKGCTSLNEYLERFDIPLRVLQESDAIERVTAELCEDLADMGLEYAEIRFAPQLSTENGLTQDEVTEAAIRGLNRALESHPDFRAGLILCCMRGDNNEEANMQNVETARKYFKKGVCAIDLAGAEALFKTENFEKVFAKAREYGIPFTIHAGEADGASSIRKAIEFGAKRLGHGVRVLEDEELLQEVIDKGIVLEVCPISNIQTQAVSDEYNHPIRKLFDMGVKVTINTDNMTVSNTTLKKEYELLKKNYNFTDEEIAQMNAYAREAAFIKF